MNISIAQSDRPHSHDRVWCEVTAESAVIVVADGAGGMPGGAAAADSLVQGIRRWSMQGPTRPEPEGLCALLSELDRDACGDPHLGETTAVVVIVGSGRVVGASCGDSEAWLVGPTALVRLTADQSRRRIGSGRAAPVAFVSVGEDGTRLLLATDGLFGFVKEKRILDVCRAQEVGGADDLVAAARSSNGTFGDDATVVVVGLAAPPAHAAG